MKLLISDMLTRAQTRLRDPSKWAQHHGYEDDKGNDMIATPELATRYCPIVAVSREYLIEGFSTTRARSGTAPVEAQNYLQKAANVLDDTYGFVTLLNKRGHDVAMHLFDTAIRLAKRDEDNGIVHSLYVEDR